MSNIPEARRILEHVTDMDIGLRAHIEVQKALKLLTRRKPVMRAKKTKKPLTAAGIEKAKRWRKTGMHQADIAARLNVNPGRISELGI